jgi:hypothetical protein
MVMALVAGLSLGCGVGRFVQKGIDSYQRGDYAGAMHQWNELSSQESDMNAKGLMRYCVYRGLTHNRLGQKQAALQWLTRGADLYKRGDPAWLPVPAYEEMNRVLAELGGGAGAPAASP